MKDVIGLLYLSFNDKSHEDVRTLQLMVILPRDASHMVLRFSVHRAVISTSRYHCFCSTFTTMSWMDSWSRPGKTQATPPPLYLTQPDTKYCHTCGRVISERKSHKAAEKTSTPPKYCSAKCRGQKPRDKDRRIEAAFAALLTENGKFEGDEISKEVLDMRIKPKAKGERRLVVPCSAAETLVFGSRYDPNKVFGRRKNRASRALSTGEDEWKSVDMVDDSSHNGRVRLPVIESIYEEHLLDADRADDSKHDSMVEFSTTGFAGKTRPPQHLNDVNGSIGGEKGRAEREQETEEDEAKRLEGQRIAEERERVKRAARRCCVFGLETDPAKGSPRRLCGAIMQGQVVEPSFAKGDWGIRWREL